MVFQFCHPSQNVQISPVYHIQVEMNEESKILVYISLKMIINSTIQSGNGLIKLLIIFVISHIFLLQTIGYTLDLCPRLIFPQYINHVSRELFGLFADIMSYQPQAGGMSTLSSIFLMDLL